MDKNEFDYLYDDMSEGQKQHMVNRIYLRDGIYAQQLGAQPEVYSIGQRFKVVHKGGNMKGVYMLASVGSEPLQVSLVNLKEGTRWNEGVEVKHIFRITEAEMGKIADSAIFKRVKG